MNALESFEKRRQDLLWYWDSQGRAAACDSSELLDALQAYRDSLVHGCQCCIAPVLLLVNASWPTAGAAASVEGLPSAATPAASLADRCCAGSSCSDRRIVLMFSMVGARELAWQG